MIARRPPPKPPARSPSAAPADGERANGELAKGELDGRIRQGEVERMRRQAADRGFQDQIKGAARARGQDPYEMLAQAIRQLLRGD